MTITPTSVKDMKDRILDKPVLKLR